ncbi:hypothetical protein Tco_0699441 [Tanacetum coccineum]
MSRWGVMMMMMMMINKVMMKELNLMMTKALISIRQMMKKKHKKMCFTEFVHTPDDYVPTDDETHDVDDEEYDRINEEMYDDVNVELKDAELIDEGKGDEEMTDAEKVNPELEEVNQEVERAQVQDEAQATTTADPAQVASSSRSVSSNYGSIFLNLDNISSVETKIISMLDVQVQHEVPIALKEFDQKRTLFETITKSKSFDRNPKHKALYHALMESILKDEDAMDKGVVDKKTSKDAEPSKKVKSTDTSEGTTKSQPKSTGKFAQSKEIVFEAGDTQLPQKLGEDMGKTDEPPIVNADPKDCDLAKAEKPSKMLNELMSTPINFTAFAMNHLQISDLTKTYLVPVYNLLKGTLINVKVNKWYGYGHLEEIEVRRSDQKLYKFMEGDFLRIHLNDIEDMLLLNQRDLPRDIPLDRIKVLRYDTKGVTVRKGIMQTKTELTLEQTQQGVSDEVLVGIEGVEE